MAALADCCHCHCLRTQPDPVSLRVRHNVESISSGHSPLIGPYRHMHLSNDWIITFLYFYLPRL